MKAQRILKCLFILKALCRWNFLWSLDMSHMFALLEIHPDCYYKDKLVVAISVVPLLTLFSMNIKGQCILWKCMFLTSHWGQELRTLGGLEEQQISSERDRLSENTVVQLKQDRHATLNRTTGFVAAAIYHDLHLTHSTGSLVRRTVGLIYLNNQYQKFIF